MDNNFIPIFLATDEGYAPYAAIMMYTVLQHTRSPVRFYVLDGGMCPETRTKVISTCASFPHGRIEFIGMHSFESRLRKISGIETWPISMFYRYFIPEINPDLQKILYIDVDIVATGDIAELYAQPLNGHPLGAILENYYGHAELRPHYKGGQNYFNSGVLLMDLARFRQHQATERLLQRTQEMIEMNILGCADQDVLNDFFLGQVQPLDDRFNLMPDLIDRLRAHKGKAGEASIRHPVLLHYAGKRKPWRTFSCNYSERFRAVAEKTVFWDDIYRSIVMNDFAFVRIPFSTVRDLSKAMLPLHFRKLMYTLKMCFHRREKRILYRNRRNGIQRLMTIVHDIQRCVKKHPLSPFLSELASIEKVP